MQTRLHHADSIQFLKTMPEASLLAVVSDPPYGLEFMGKEWDSFGPRNPALDEQDDEQNMPETGRNSFEQFNVDWLKGAYRALVPGGVVKAFGGTRLFHRLAIAMERTGFILVPGQALEAWCYGNGFPKSLNVSRALDDLLGMTGTVVGTEVRKNSPSGLVNVGQGGEHMIERKILEPVSEQAKKFTGYGTALKPAWEPVLVGIKPE